jgi:hypothetical protein
MVEEHKTSMAAHNGTRWQAGNAAARHDDIKTHINRLREFMLNGSDRPDSAERQALE